MEKLGAVSEADISRAVDVYLAKNNHDIETSLQDKLDVLSVIQTRLKYPRQNKQSLKEIYKGAQWDEKRFNTAWSLAERIIKFLGEVVVSGEQQEEIAQQPVAPTDPMDLEATETRGATTAKNTDTIPSDEAELDDGDRRRPPISNKPTPTTRRENGQEPINIEPDRPPASRERMPSYIILAKRIMRAFGKPNDVEDLAGQVIVTLSTFEDFLNNFNTQTMSQGEINELQIFVNDIKSIKNLIKREARSPLDLSIPRGTNNGIEQSINRTLFKIEEIQKTKDLIGLLEKLASIKESPLTNRPPLAATESEAELIAFFGASFDREYWQDQALCAQTDPEVFFPEQGGSTKEAKRVCASCEVRAECLEYALDHNERFGIWGGLSERERRKMIKNITRTRQEPLAEEVA